MPDLLSDGVGVEALARAVAAGQRMALARAITAIESNRPDRAALGRAVLERLLPLTGKAVRVGITGTPGVGKSSFIEAIGTRLTSRGQRVAVLAVDPSSERSGGSILGDKTRMPNLAIDGRAFVRPSPASGMLGGVARMTREAMLLCEAAGYDVVLVETVGVGQSETVVAQMVDSFLILALPGAGDELQGIKKGIVELADLVAITKADGDNVLRAQQARQHWRLALHIIEPDVATWRPPVLMISALEGQGLDELWATVLDHRHMQEASGDLVAKRRRQALGWFKSLLGEQLQQRLRALPEMATAVPDAERAVLEGRRSPGAAVDKIVALLAHRFETLRGGVEQPSNPSVRSYSDVCDR